MSEFNINIKGGSSVRLLTAGKYCDRDITVTASGSGGGTEEIENIIDQSGVLGSTDGTIEDKVEQLIDKAESENDWYKQSANWNKAESLFLYSKIKKAPRVNYENVTSIVNLFNGSTVETIDYYINSSKCKSAVGAFGSTTSLKFMVGVDLSSTTNITDLLRSSAIETIREPLDLSKVTTYARAFWADYIKDIRFVANSIKFPFDCGSPYLTDESVQSIIDGLADLTSGTALTLTLNATVKAKLTEEQLATITNKNWNLA